MIMSALYSTSEIIELTESCGFESKISGDTGKQRLEKSLQKPSIEDDINKIFEAIKTWSSRQNVSHRNAMKRPMRVSPAHASGIGISQSMSLKQALRGLCISHASEMAAVKKRVSRPSASPGISEIGAIKKLYRAVVIEGNLMEIPFVPERSSSNVSYRALESGNVSVAELSQRKGQSSVLLEGDSPIPTNHACGVPKSDLVQGMKLSHSTASITLDKDLLEFGEIGTIRGETSQTSSEKHKKHVDKLRLASLSSNDLKTGLIRSPSKGFGLCNQTSRTQNIAKKKILPKRTFATKIHNQRNEGPKNDISYQTSKIVTQRPDTLSEKRCKEMEKSSPSLSSHAEIVASSNSLNSTASKHYHVAHVFSKTMCCMMIADNRSRSRDKGGSESSKSNIEEYSSTTSYGDESYLSGSSRSGYRPHISNNLKWEAINSVQKQHGSLGMTHFKLLRKIGGGDIGTVYLSELIGTSCLFAMKVMDNQSLTSKKKMHRAQTEKEILEILDHPFLPTLFAHFTTNKYSCLVMEYCPGGDLNVLRQNQFTKSFPEKAARFYAAEILLALEYLHMLGVVYRDLKPENILIREDGHIMLSDFNFSLRCAANPMLLKSSPPVFDTPKKMSSPSWQLSCFTPAAKTRKPKSEQAAPVIPLPQLVVEPVSARSNSFVGTHEYLAPEMIKGEGHGSAVDWWAFGIFLYELLYGTTPFKGSSDEDTVSNVVSQCLKFPEFPMVSCHGRDLMRRLLKKEAENRLGSAKGAAEIKQHPFFEGLNWALIRCEMPPELPKAFDLGNVMPLLKEMQAPHRIGLSRR